MYVKSVVSGVLYKQHENCNTHLIFQDSKDSYPGILKITAKKRTEIVTFNTLYILNYQHSDQACWCHSSPFHM